MLQVTVRGAKGQAHTTIANAHHFLQEDQGEQLADIFNAFIAATS